jgi:hypothetical protein
MPSLKVLATVIGQVIFFGIIVLVVYARLKVHLLSKYHPNKYLILLVSVAMFFVPNLVATQLNIKIAGTIGQYIQAALFIIFFLWFVDLRGGNIVQPPKQIPKRGHYKETTIRPKAKKRNIKKR